MSVSTIRGGRGRGRGGYRPIRRPSHVESNNSVNENHSDDDKKSSDKIMLPPKFSISMPIASQTVSPSPHPLRKPLNIFNLTSQSHITQVETSKLMEQLKVSSGRDNKNEDDVDERVNDEKPRCEFCASVDHPTRNCSLFKPPPSNACYTCKEVGHYKSHCPKRAERNKFNNYRGQSFRSGVKAYGSRSGTSLKWNASSVINDVTEDEEDDESTTANTNSVCDKLTPIRPARINVPMPVPASSIKPTIQLRSKIKSTDSPCIKPFPAVKSLSKTSSYIRSDTEDEFSSSSGDEKEPPGSSTDAKMTTAQIKDKFDLSVVNEMIKAPITPSEFAKQFMGGAQHKQQRSVIKETILPFILKDAVSKIEEEEEEKDNAEPVQEEKAVLEPMIETAATPALEDDGGENKPTSVMSDIRQDAESAASSEMSSDADEDHSQINADIEFYGCDGAILSENDSELQEKTDRDKISADESEDSDSESAEKE